jgi:hypothetical protein
MRIIAIVLLAGFLTGCMSDHEYMLRKNNAENQSAHEQTYDVAEITGPVTIGQGATFRVRAATQPFAPIDVPDGIAAQRGVIRDVLTGAVIGYGLHRAGATTNYESSHNTTTTSTTSTGAAQ